MSDLTKTGKFMLEESNFWPLSTMVCQGSLTYTPHIKVFKTLLRINEKRSLVSQSSQNSKEFNAIMFGFVLI